MVDLHFERRALLNLLRRNVACYRIAATFLDDADLAALLVDAALAREQVSEQLLALWSWDADPVPVEQALLDDARRCASSGTEAICAFTLGSEQRLADLLDDLSEAALDAAEHTGLADMIEALRERIGAILADLGSELSGGVESLGFGLGHDTRGRSVKHGASAYRLWFGTNRTPIEQDGRVVGFGADRGDTVHVGTCDVVIPENHRVGSTGSPWWRRLVRGDDRLRIADIAALDPDAFWADLREQMGTVDERDAVVFLHGYNVKFEEAALQAAQIGADLDIKGAMAFYSWPSRGRLLGYILDEASIEASEARIAQFLADVAERSGAARIHLIAHSMGNRGLLRAVNRIATQAAHVSGTPFAQIILAAPDVDADTFHSLAGAYREVAERTTLYVSAADLAVRASRLIHGAARVGFTPPVATFEGIDTVSVTNVDLTLLGHGYVASCRNVLIDMHALLKRGEAPSARAMLRPRQTTEGAAYWEIAA